MTPDEIVARCKELVARGTKPTLPEVRAITSAWYALDGNLAGGGLHCVLDDGNYERVFIQSCIDDCEDHDYPDCVEWIGHVLLMLSNSQRRRGA